MWIAADPDIITKRTCIFFIFYYCIKVILNQQWMVRSLLPNKLWLHLWFLQLPNTLHHSHSRFCSATSESCIKWVGFGSPFSGYYYDPSVIHHRLSLILLVSTAQWSLQLDHQCWQETVHILMSIPKKWMALIWLSQLGINLAALVREGWPVRDKLEQTGSPEE